MKKQIKVTKEWAAKRDPCPKAVRKFFQRWPNGLTLNRRNLYMVARECPLSYLAWFTYEQLGASWQAEDLIYEWAGAGGVGYVVSPAKKQAFAKALADALKL